MKKVLVMGIPHTGTEFVVEYLNILSLVVTRPATTFIQHPSNHVLYNTYIGSYANANHYPGEKEVMEYAKENCKVVIPLRHPTENAISYISRYKEMASCANNWNILINYIIPKYDIFWFDINIAKQKRFKMMEKLNKFIEHQPTDDLKFRKYVSEWKPVNHVEYQDNLSEGHDFECLDMAIDWYNNKKVELNKLYE